MPFVRVDDCWLAALMNLKRVGRCYSKACSRPGTIARIFQLTEDFVFLKGRSQLT